MVSTLLKLSLRHRWLVLFLAAALLAVGVYRAQEMPVDVFPDLTAPRVTVVTESTGMASEEVERLITFPIETAVNGTSGVRRVRSASAPGISIVWVEFDWSTDQTIARQRVTERLRTVSALPPEAEPPLLAPESSVMGEIAFIAITSDQVDEIALRRAADVEVRQTLLAVEGVSQVVPIGGKLKQYQVLVDPTRLERFHLSINDVLSALEHGSENAPGGFVVSEGQESVVRVLGRAESVSDLKTIVITTHEGSPIRIRDVADVEIGSAVARGAASYMASPAVIFSIIKQPEAGTVGTTARVDEVLGDLSESLATRGIELHGDVFRQQDFIDTAIANLVEVIRDGSILVIVVLFLFLWSIRPTLISVVAIPVSLLTAVLVLDLFGVGINTMTLGGLAIAIGELVDDAIVDVENVVRRLRERALLPIEQQEPLLRTVYTASLEVRSAIVSATLVLMVVFVPLLFLDGLEGRLLRPIGISYLAAIFASLLVAITITPALCSLLLTKGVVLKGRKESPLMAFVGRLYEPILQFSLKRPLQVITMGSVFVIVGLLAFSGLGRSFLPEFNEGSLTINMILTPGTSLEQSDALATMAEQALLTDEAVLSVGRRTGRAERDEHVLGVETSEIEVRLDPDDPRTKEELFADIRERLKAVPGAQFTLGQPISHRIEHMISGQRAALSIKVFGDNLSELRQVAAQIESAVGDTDGLVDLNVEQMVNIPQLVVRVDPQAASNYGFSLGEASRAIGTALWGQVPTHIYEDGTTTEVVVKYDPSIAESIETVRRAMIPSPSGALVPISALADVSRDSGPNFVLREDVQRRIVVTANVSSRDVRSVFEEVRAKVKERVQTPEGVRITYAGQFQREEAAQNQLMIYGFLALLCVGFIVATTVRSIRRTLIVLANLPLALAGGVVGVFLAGGVLSVATTIGFITLFGIATRNGILLATRARDLELSGSERISAVAGAARERLAPILMTAVTAAFGLLPLGLALGQPGSEIQAPMALVILTGLVGSTALNMVVVPALLGKWGGPPEWKIPDGHPENVRFSTMPPPPSGGQPLGYPKVPR